MDRSLWWRCGIVILAVCMSMAVWQPSPAHAARKKILKIAAKEPDTLDPHSSTIGQTQAIVRFLYRGLTRFAIKDGKVTTAEVEPDLAESWTVSDDGTVWTLSFARACSFTITLAR
jgi:peptide/nickel transport system substrate-binding protein